MYRWNGVGTEATTIRMSKKPDASTTHDASDCDRHKEIAISSFSLLIHGRNRFGIGTQRFPAFLSVVYARNGLGVAVCVQMGSCPYRSDCGKDEQEPQCIHNTYVNASECDMHKEHSNFQPFVTHPWPIWFRYRRLCTDGKPSVQKRLGFG